jgi:glycosyltransferase involved in cell wall biosynthesis
MKTRARAARGSDPRRLRILVVSSDTFPPTRVDVSVLFGVELAARGHEIDWILQSEAACPRAYVVRWGSGRVWVGATDLGQSLASRLRKHVLGIANDCRLFSRLRRERYDAIEVKDKFLSGVLALIASRLFRMPFIYWLSYPFPEHYLQCAKDGTARYPFLYRLRGLAFQILLYRLLLPAADHVFVQSEQMRADIGREGVPTDKMTAVPMGVNAELCRSAEPSQDREVLAAGVPSILYLGTLNKLRRLDFLIRAFARVRTSVPAARLYIVGRGDDPADELFLEAEVSRLNLQSSVVFVGQLPQAEALRFVREADVCVSPFYPMAIFQSTSPTKLVEYMAMGKAVVANDHPEQKRVIEESGGGYCVPYEEQSFADAIAKLLKDPEAAQSMGQRGRRYVLEHRTYGIIATAVEKQLLDIVEPRC